ncbi:ImuA family protein [Mucilaginibacter arboris]|uniref:Error-prone repair protein ImuA n=1 Tax=Mucilaginibacter arboris TaxID=2682090 RepID=A0A7K1T0F7_9SPHI|nr:Error-prone repair protein ImuA [Mucilaginibacter arboris]MVN23008.1 Error-prone repair protein ImuA [Mucilaginibacter arboris]
MEQAKRDIIAQLRKDILLMEGFKPATEGATSAFGLGPIEAAFPNGVFPAGSVHEVLNLEAEHTGATGGFIAGLLSVLMRSGGPCLWISTCRKLFPPALKAFGVEPERIIFIDIDREKDVLWAVEEALKYKGLAAVVAELRELSFTQSRRLQLAVEESRVTGFILRHDPLKISPTACVARWQVKPLPSETEDDLPGVGYPRWQVELLKVRNGNPGTWTVEWSEEGFNVLPAAEAITEEQILKFG